MFLAFFPFNRISNLRVFNAALSSIPTAPTNISDNQLQICEGAGFFLPLLAYCDLVYDGFEGGLSCQRSIGPNAQPSKAYPER